MSQFIKKSNNKILVMEITYTDLHDNQRTVRYKEKGPAGNRWILDGHDTVTIDYVFDNNNRLINPWDNARDLKTKWVELE